MQWDISYNVNTLSKIDISQDNFNNKKHQINAFKLSLLLDLSILLLLITTYPFYKPNIWIVLIFTIPTLIDLFIVPFYNLKKNYLQINYSPLKVTIITQLANTLRMLCSFWVNPYCTLVGQEITIYFQLICFYFIFKKNYFINKEGLIKSKTKEKYKY